MTYRCQYDLVAHIDHIITFLLHTSKKAHEKWEMLSQFIQCPLKLRTSMSKTVLNNNFKTNALQTLKFVHVPMHEHSLTFSVTVKVNFLKQ